MGNHDGSRVGSRLGSDMIDWMNVLILSLPGASVNYYVRPFLYFQLKTVFDDRKKNQT